MTEISNYAKYRVTGPGAEAWLSSLLTARMPAPGRITLTAMLNEAGRIVGEFTVARASEADEFYLFGSLPAEAHHSRWFRHHLPRDGSVRFEVLGLGLVGLSVTGPRSRDVLAAVAPDLDLSTEAFPFMTFRHVDLGMTPAHLARINYAGDLGYELWVAPEYQRALFDRIVAAGEPHGLRLFGMRALMSLRLEKSYGTWFREYRPIYTPARGRHHALHQARPRVHRAGGARGGAGGRRPEAAAGRVRRRARPGRPGRRHRRRAGLARRGGRGLGDIGRVRPLTSGSRSRSATCRPPWRRRTARAATGSRSRSSGGGGLRASSPSRCSTRRAPGCASDRGHRRADRRRRLADRRSRRGFGRGRDPPRRRGAGARRDAVPGRRLRELPGGGRRHRVRADVPDAGAAGVAGRAASGRRRTRHSPWWSPRT